MDPNQDPPAAAPPAPPAPAVIPTPSISVDKHAKALAENKSLAARLADLETSNAELQKRTLSDHEQAAFDARDRAKTESREATEANAALSARIEQMEQAQTAQAQALRKQALSEAIAKETGRSPKWVSVMIDGMVSQGTLEGVGEDIEATKKAALEGLAEFLEPQKTGALDQSGGFIPKETGPSSTAAKFAAVNADRAKLGLPPITVPTG